mgnify:CR=1 FL=1
MTQSTILGFPLLPRGSVVYGDSEGRMSDHLHFFHRLFRRSRLELLFSLVFLSPFPRDARCLRRKHHLLPAVRTRPHGNVQVAVVGNKKLFLRTVALEAAAEVENQAFCGQRTTGREGEENVFLFDGLRRQLRRQRTAEIPSKSAGRRNRGYLSRWRRGAESRGSRSVTAGCGEGVSSKWRERV